MRAIVASSLCIALAACGTIEQAPTARPLSQANIEALGPTRLSVTGDQVGVGKAWYYTQSNGGGAGLAGVIGAAIVDAIVNAAPSARARRQASEVAELVTPEQLDASLLQKVKATAAAAPASSLTFPEVVLTQKVANPGALEDALEITTSYTLSEDSSVLRVVAVATYANKAMPYKSPYSFAKQAPTSEKSGPLYRNVFTYYSTPLPVPTLTPELKERLVASVQDSMRDEAGALPVAGSSEFKAMTREIENARDDKLTPGEISVFLTREWLKDGGARLKREINSAQDFIAKYVVTDVNRTAIPSMSGTDELLETTADDRTVRRIGAGVETGSYVSSAANVTGFATYGNAVAVGKTTIEYVKGLKARSQKKS
jgi:hypothetical protein